LSCRSHRGNSTDLIAAGHPRLRFEYSAFLASSPGKHWKSHQDRRRTPDLEARAWVIGQLVSAEAALTAVLSCGQGPGRKWQVLAEFAEYNCVGCHYNLTGKLEHQERGFGSWLAGSLPWGTWYYPLLPTLGRLMPGYESKDLL